MYIKKMDISKIHVNMMKRFLNKNTKEKRVNINNYLENFEVIKEEEVFKNLIMYIEAEVNYDDANEPESFYLEFNLEYYNRSIIREKITKKVELIYAEREYYCTDEVEYDLNNIKIIMNKFEELRYKENEK